MAKYRILSLDGGGIRGILTSTLLERLEKRVPGWLAQTDLFAGTSAGGLIALGLAAGLTPQKISEFYRQQGPVIFRASLWEDIIAGNRLYGALYQTEPKRQALAAILGDTKLGDFQKRVLIPAFDLDNADPKPTNRTEKPKFFHNFPGQDSDGKELAVNVGLYTSAAPSYFPSVDGFIDGGIVVNNPSMSAIAQTQDSRALIDPRPGINDIVLLSLGTGNTLTYVQGQTLNWGLLQWAQPLLRILLDSEGGIADYECRQLLGDNYCRLNPLLPPGKTIELDDVAQIPVLVQTANAVDLDAVGVAVWLQNIWMN